MPAPIDSEPEGDIILSAAEARQIAQFLSLFLNGGRRGLARASVPQTKPQTDDASPERRAKLVARAKAVLVERKRRNQFFPLILFGEIGWEMLLWLYVTDHSGERQTVGRLSKFVDAPHTTALRWIGYLEGEGFIEKVPHPNDRRTVFVRLLDRARDRLDQWLEMVAEPFADTSSLPGSF